MRLFGCSLLLLLALVAGSVQARGGALPRRNDARWSVRISAHRGGAGQWPQDSLLAFRNALAAGYDEIEGDAWILADGSHVIYHDATISGSRCGSRYAGRDIWRLTFDQVRTVRCQGQPIPTEAGLVSLVSRSENRHAVLRLETKSFPGQSPRSAANWARSVSDPVVDVGLTSRTIVQDFNWSGFAGYHAASRRLRVSALTTEISHADVFRARRLGAYDISYNARYATRALNRFISAQHLVPTVWGIDAVPMQPGRTPPSVRSALRDRFPKDVCAGVKVIITNYPELLMAWRARISCNR